MREDDEDFREKIIGRTVPHHVKLRSDLSFTLQIRKDEFVTQEWSFNSQDSEFISKTDLESVYMNSMQKKSQAGGD